MLKQNKTIITLLISLVVFNAFSQEEEIKTDVINVTKAYKPSISDAFKVKEQPGESKDVTNAKQEISYNILSFPVASTFAPAKPKAEKLEKPKKEKFFDNYASFGAGNYLHLLGDLYLNTAFGRNQSVGFYAGHHSSQGGIKSVMEDDTFSDTKTKLNYTLHSKSYSLFINGGYQFQTFNWYGIPRARFDNTIARTINDDVKHNYANAHFSANMDFLGTYFKSGSVMYRRFSDSYASAENRVLVTATGEIPIGAFDFLTTVYGDYVGGNFKRDYAFNKALAYNTMQFGIAPSFKLIRDNLSANIGVKALYWNSTGAIKNSLFIYPNADASLRLAGDVLILYGVAKGELTQNSYYGFATQNPYVSPNLYIQPTNQLFNVYGGVKGLVSNTVSYDVSGGVKTEKRKPLFKNNLITYVSDFERPYHQGNSFGVVYDNVTTLSVAGKLNIDINRNFTLGVKSEYFKYTTKKQEEAWNLPNLKADVLLDYQINEKWFAGSNLFFVGTRQAVIGRNYVNEATNQITTIAQKRTLKSYIDVNINGGYHINKQFSAYAKINNLLGKNYELWTDKPVQGFQVLVGATYKFNF